MYKVNDIVLVRSRGVPAMKPFRVKLLKKEVVKPRKGNHIDWPGYTGWHAKLTRKADVIRLRKRWQIPFSYPHDVATFIFEEEIIKKL